jgi:protease I
MHHRLEGKRVAILSEKGFEQSELLEPKKALEEAGAMVDVISPEAGKIKGWNHDDWGKAVKVDIELGEADPEDYDALMLPGGVMNPDQLRTNITALRFIQSFVDAGKPIAAICHGPQTLIEIGFLKGRRMTSWPSLRTDLSNAGAIWSDEPVVVDKGFVTSRMPDDLPYFNAKMIEEIAEGPRQGRYSEAG